MRKDHKWTTLDLEKKSGVSNKSISEYERGIVHPKRDNLEKLAAALGVTVDSLYIKSKTYTINLATNNQDTVEISKELYLIPVYNTACSAGKFTEHPDTCVEEHLEVPASLCPDREAGAIRVKGDSMEPEVHDGDTVFFSKNYRIKANDMVVVMIDSEGLALKRVQFIGDRERPEQYALLSTNPKYPARVVPARDLVAMHKVIAIHRSLI
jgi:repressor LexA